MPNAEVGRPLNVLIVDDSDDDAQRVLAELRRGGFDPTHARVETWAGFLAAMPRQPWEVVIANHPLPQFGVMEALELLRARGRDLPVIVVSGRVAEDELVAVMKAGARDCLGKSSLGRLSAAVERELREAAVRSARSEAERGRREAEDLYRTLIEEIPALTYVAWADAVGSTTYVSPQLTAMTGFSPGEWLAEPERWAKQIHPEDRDRVLVEYRESWSANRPFACEYRILHRDGRVRWWRDEARTLRDASGRPRFVRGFAVDITERKNAEETIRYMTYHDPMTGLPNRTSLVARLEQTVADGRADGRPVGLLFLTLDRFREINNTLGHRNGDRVITALAARLSEVLGEGDRVARLRGDEFAMLLPGADAALAQQVAAKVLKALEAPFLVERLPIEVGASVGIAIWPNHAGDAEMLLRRADVAMQAAKRQGGGLVVYSSECDPHDPRRLILLGELRRAIESDQLLLHYQPKVHLERRLIIGAEALVRWRHPKHGMVPPDQFVPLAEQGGLIKPLTRWVLNQALAQCELWAAEGRHLPVAVNLSARNLQDGQLVEDVATLLASHHLAPQLLELELTESAVMADPARATEILDVLEASGVTLAIDDFGTGYSSLAYLRRLPVTELKIDKSFVIGMAASGEEDTVIVRSTNELGHNLGLKVVAEGVEDERTLDQLRSFGCDAAQGYFIARPMAAADLGKWLKDCPWRPAA
jgi:diguanylate cyclase (GGDEF)-like protein/PAS domain S-box-containing protein